MPTMPTMFDITFDQPYEPYLSDRVERGAAWLDANRPGWRDAIDLDRLNLASPCGCVLGQTFKDDVPDFLGAVSGYGLVWDVVRDAALDYETAMEWMRQHGFEHDPDYEVFSYAALTDTWADYLQTNG